LCFSAAFLSLGGCGGSPSQANIQLRKELQSKADQIASLQRAHEADLATIRQLEQQRGTLPTLPQERLAALFTAHGIKLGRLTGGADLDPSRPGDEGLKVYVVPTDETGDELKSAGSFVVELFDLNQSTGNLVLRREFDAAQAKEQWLGSALLYEYVLTCPWENPPQNPELTLKVTFRDELTGRQFDVQKVITVNVPRSQ
jgi:hypothetical protein